MTSIVEMDELGRRIRRLRSERRLTLKQVESVSGLSATHLSEIERGRTSPTIGALARIARALEKDVAYFIEADERPDVAHVLREQVVSRAAGGGARVEALTSGIPGSGLFPHRLRLEAGAELRLPSSEPPDEIVLHVLSGPVTVRAGEQSYSLGAGDTLQATTGAGLSLRADGPAPGEVVVVSPNALENLR